MHWYSVVTSQFARFAEPTRWTQICTERDRNTKRATPYTQSNKGNQTEDSNENMSHSENTGKSIIILKSLTLVLSQFWTFPK